MRLCEKDGKWSGNTTTCKSKRELRQHDFVVIFGINTTSDISKLLYIISRAVRRVKFETILKCHE